MDLACRIQLAIIRHQPVESQAMVLLLIFMSAGSILMGNLLQSYINSDANADDRTWVWEYYGTAYR